MAGSALDIELSLVSAGADAVGPVLFICGVNLVKPNSIAFALPYRVVKLAEMPDTVRTTRGRPDSDDAAKRSLGTVISSAWLP